MTHPQAARTVQTSIVRVSRIDIIAILTAMCALVLLGSGCKAPQSGKSSPWTVFVATPHPPQALCMYLDVTTSDVQTLGRAAGDVTGRLEPMLAKAGYGSVAEVWTTGKDPGNPQLLAVYEVPAKKGSKMTWAEQKIYAKQSAAALKAKLAALVAQPPPLAYSPIIEDTRFVLDRAANLGKEETALVVYSDAAQYSPFLKAARILACDNPDFAPCLAAVTKQFPPLPHLTTQCTLVYLQPSASEHTIVGQGETFKRFLQRVFLAWGVPAAAVTVAEPTLQVDADPVPRADRAAGRASRP